MHARRLQIKILSGTVMDMSLPLVMAVINSLESILGCIETQEDTFTRGYVQNHQCAVFGDRSVIAMYSERHDDLMHTLPLKQ